MLYWSAIKWAREQGYRYCDFTWIDPKIARMALQGEPIPDSLKQNATFFKLGFGGQVTISPGGYDYVYNPLLRWAYHKVGPRISKSPMVRNIFNHLRWRWFPSLRMRRGAEKN